MVARLRFGTVLFAAARVASRRASMTPCHRVSALNFGDRDCVPIRLVKPEKTGHEKTDHACLPGSLALRTSVPN